MFEFVLIMWICWRINYLRKKWKWNHFEWKWKYSDSCAWFSSETIFNPQKMQARFPLSLASSSVKLIHFLHLTDEFFCTATVCNMYICWQIKTWFIYAHVVDLFFDATKALFYVIQCEHMNTTHVEAVTNKNSFNTHLVLHSDVMHA